MAYKLLEKTLIACISQCNWQFIDLDFIEKQRDL